MPKGFVVMVDVITFLESPIIFFQDRSLRDIASLHVVPQSFDFGQSDRLSYCLVFLVLIERTPKMVGLSCQEHVSNGS